MQRTGFRAVDFYGRIGHHAFEHDEDALAAPVGGDIKTMAVVAANRRVIFVFKTVTKFSESLQFPTRGHGDVRPHAAVAPVGTIKIPRHGVLAIGAGKILPDSFLRRGGDETGEAKNGCE